VIILRNTAAVSDAPADGNTYSTGGSIGTSDIVYAGNLQTYTDTSVTNGTGYFYKVFSRDTHNNYSTGSATGPHTPTAPNNPPSLSISQPDGNGDTVTVGDSYNITYTLSDSEDTVTAAFYYDDNSAGLNGTLIASCTAAAEAANGVCTLNTSAMAPGSYYIYGLTSDGVNPQVSAYSSGALTIISPLPTTTLGSGSDPAGTIVEPGTTDQFIDEFTFTTDNAGGASVSALTVTTANTAAVANIEVWNSSFTTKYFTTLSSPSGSSWNFSGGISIPVTASPATYRLRLTFKDHSALAAGTYAVTARVTAFTTTDDLTAGSDSAGTSITVDNLAPADPAWRAILAGDSQIVLNWTNPSNSDFTEVIILRNTAAVSDAPADGNTYSTGGTIGTSNIVYAGALQTYTDVSVTNGTGYSYKVFSRDMRHNYSAGTSTGPHTPSSPPSLSISQPDGAGDYVSIGSNYQITYTLSDSDDAATVTFYYDRNNKDYNGKAIGGECASAPEGINITCTWNTSNVKKGKYYIYGIASDGSNEAKAYSAGKVEVLNSGNSSSTTNTPPTLTIHSFSKNNNYKKNNTNNKKNSNKSLAAVDNFRITYTLYDEDDTVTAAFYYDKNNKGYNGKAIGGECASAPEGNNLTCTWNTNGVKKGKYYIYGIASDGYSKERAYSKGKVEVLKAKKN
jgi:hypothetical protein